MPPACGLNSTPLLQSAFAARLPRSAPRASPVSAAPDSAASRSTQHLSHTALADPEAAARRPDKSNHKQSYTNKKPRVVPAVPTLADNGLPLAVPGPISARDSAVHLATREPQSQALLRALLVSDSPTSAGPRSGAAGSKENEADAESGQA